MNMIAEGIRYKVPSAQAQAFEPSSVRHGPSCRREMANMAAFMASDKASGMTGTTVNLPI
jgi:hypothetical protein